ncbi:MAG: hypothetical protein ACTHJ6_07660 [Oryzihumus sp.]
MPGHPVGQAGGALGAGGAALVGVGEHGQGQPLQAPAQRVQPRQSLAQLALGHPPGVLGQGPVQAAQGGGQRTGDRATDVNIEIPPHSSNIHATTDRAPLTRRLV